MIQFVVLFLSLWLLYFLINDTRKPKNFPNGPFFYPIIGNILTIAELRKKTGFIVKAVQEIAKKYANTQDIIGLKIGKDRVVFTLSAKGFKEIYLNPDFEGRPYGPFYETRTWNKRRGIIFTDQDFFQAQHRFLVRQLKDFGFARKGMTEICENEVEFFVNDFRKMIENNNGMILRMEMNNIMQLYILNTLWQFMTGARYDVNNEDLKNLQNILNDLLKSIDMKGSIFSHFPILQYIAPDASGYRYYVKCHNNLHDFMRREVERHKRNFNPSDEPRDLIDAYLKVLHAGDESGKAHSSFSEQQLLAICLDMFMAGSETTNNTTDFLILHLIRNQDIQRRAREEIDRVIGRNRLPKLTDRPNLPYCEAIIQESLRTFLNFSCGVAHRALKDSKLCGFDIPKDTMLISTFNPLTFDINAYKNPNDFYPENFLDENQNPIVVENFLPFALGKRRCIGELMARTNLFLILTTLLQNFYLALPEGHELPSKEPIDSLTPSVRNYEGLIILRK